VPTQVDVCNFITAPQFADYQVGQRPCSPATRRPSSARFATGPARSRRATMHFPFAVAETLIRRKASGFSA
jgi:hypothetical protein